MAYTDLRHGKIEDYPYNNNIGLKLATVQTVKVPIGILDKGSAFITVDNRVAIINKIEHDYTSVPIMSKVTYHYSGTTQKLIMETPKTTEVWEVW